MPSVFTILFLQAFNVFKQKPNAYRKNLPLFAKESYKSDAITVYKYSNQCPFKSSIRMKKQNKIQFQNNDNSDV